MCATDCKQLVDLKEEIDARLAAVSSLSTEQIRSIRREFSKRVARTSPEFVVKLALLLIKGSGIANRFVAYELVQHHNEALRSLTANVLSS